MKKVVLLGLLFIGLNGLAQGTGVWKGSSENESIQTGFPYTTEKEYNYLTKGLKIQKESGLDVIAGYKLNEIGTTSVTVDKQYIFTFTNLIETSTKDLKGISVTIKSEAISGIWYLCIPINNSNYFLKYQQTLMTFPPNLAKAYLMAISSQFWKMDYNSIAQRK